MVDRIGILRKRWMEWKKDDNDVGNANTIYLSEQPKIDLQIISLVSRRIVSWEKECSYCNTVCLVDTSFYSTAYILSTVPR